MPCSVFLDALFHGLLDASFLGQNLAEHTPA